MNMLKDIPIHYKGFFSHMEKYKEDYTITGLDYKSNISKELPSGRRNPSNDIISQYKKLNKHFVENAIKEGQEDIPTLLRIFSNWENIHRIMPGFTFLGLRITTDCNLYGKDRCVYCDQKQYKGKISNEVLENIINEISLNGHRRGIFASISGGEPLLLFNDIYSASGLVKKLSDNGFLVNMNSNLHLISPKDTLQVINSGLANIHTSFDSSVEYIHDKLVCKGALRRTLESIKYFQIIKSILGVESPAIHINVVATKENLFSYDKLLKFLLDYRVKQTEIGLGSPYTNPGRMDLSPHLIKLGGEANLSITPTDDDWNKFEGSVLPKCRQIWNTYLSENNIELTEYNSFDVVHFYANPNKKETLQKKESSYNFTKCYIAPTQIYVMPNGDCYACGCHADIKIAPILGNIYNDSVREIQKRNLSFLNNELPHKDYCVKCSRSTQNINSMIEKKLKAHVLLLLKKKHVNKY